MQLNLTNTVEINAMQVAVTPPKPIISNSAPDHLIDHLTDILVWDDVDNDDMRLNIQSLFELLKHPDGGTYLKRKGTDQMKIDPYLFAELIYYLKDMAKRGDDTAKQFLDDLPQQ